MTSALSNLVKNLTERIHKIKYKNCKMCGIKCKDCECYLKYTSVKDDLIEYQCLCCNKSYQKTSNENIKKRFAITSKLVIMTSISLFYHCEAGFTPMNIWIIGKKLMKRRYLKKKVFTETYAECTHTKRICKDLEIKNLGEYHDLYI